MKKVILKVFGMAALAALIMFNAQVFDAEIGSNISLAALGNVAVAQSEDCGCNKVTCYSTYSGTYVGGSFITYCGACIQKRASDWTDQGECTK